MGTAECTTLYPCCFGDIKVNIVHLLQSIRIICHSGKFQDDYVHLALLLHIPILPLHYLGTPENLPLGSEQNQYFTQSINPGGAIKNLRNAERYPRITEVRKALPDH